MYAKIEDHRAYCQSHYQKNKAEYLAKNERRRKRIYETVIVVVKSEPCADCGNHYPPECMDFDHVRGKKLFNIGTSYTRYSMEKLLAEIEKCDIVCANCHRIRTKNRSIVP